MNKFLRKSIFENLNNATLFIIHLIAIIFLISLLVVTLIIVHFAHKKKQQKNKLALLTSNKTIFTYDYNRKLFFYFERFNPRNERILSHDEFLEKFILSDRGRIDAWLNDFLTNDNVSQFIQVDRLMNISKNKQSNLTFILILTKLDRKNKIIHFEMSFLPFVDETSGSRAAEKHILKDEKDINDFIHTYETSTQGAVYYIRLFSSQYNDGVAPLKNKIVSYKIYNDAILKYLSPTRKIININSTDFVIIDTSSTSKMVAISYATTIRNAANNILSAYHETTIDFIVGISIQANREKKYLQSKGEAKSMIDAIIQKKSFNKILVFDTAFTKNVLKDEKNRKDIILYIKNSTFNVYFLTTLNLKNGEYGPIFTQIRNYGLDVRGFKETVEITMKIDDDGNKCIQLFKNLDARIIRQLKSYDETFSLVISIPYDAVKWFYRAIDNRVKRNFTYIILLEEKEIAARISKQEQILREIKDYKRRKNIQTALLVQTAAISIRRTILEEMSYYVISNQLMENIQSASTQANMERISSFFKTLSAPLCYISLKDRLDIDLAKLYSCQIIQCDLLSKLSSRIQPFDKRLVDDIIFEDDKIMDEGYRTEVEEI